MNINDNWENKNLSGAKRTVANAIMPRSAKSVSEAQDIIRPLAGKPLTNNKLGITATVSGKSIDKLGSKNATKQSVNPALHAKAVANIDILFRNATFDITHPDYKRNRNIEKIHRLGSLMYDEATEKYAPVMITVKEFNNDKGSRIYTVEIIDVETKEKSAGLLTDAQYSEGHVPIADFTKYESSKEALTDFNTKIQQLIKTAKQNGKKNNN